jgi:hypothetical protein
MNDSLAKFSPTFFGFALQGVTSQPVTRFRLTIVITQVSELHLRPAGARQEVQSGRQMACRAKTRAASCTWTGMLITVANGRRVNFSAQLPGFPGGY